MTEPGNIDDLDLRSRLTLETARISWKEIEGFFARGQVMAVAPDLDLIEVAALTAEDDKATLGPWVEQGRVGQLSVAQAKAWQQGQPDLWAVVVAPWVFVQAREVK